MIGRMAARNERQRARPSRPVLPTLRRAAALVRPYRPALLGYLVTVVVASLIGLGQPLLLRELLDRAIPYGDTGLLNLLALSMIALLIVGALNGTLQSYFGNRAAHGVMFDLRRRIYSHLTGMSLRWFTSNRTGESVSRVNNDVGGIQSVFTDTLGGVLGNIVTIVSTLAVMAGLDWRLALISLASIPLFILPARRIGQLQRELVTETHEQMAQMNNQMQETLSVSGALLVKTFGRQDSAVEDFEQTARAVRDLNIRRALIGRWFTMTVNLFGSLVPPAVYWYGGYQIIGGTVSLGTVVAEAALLTRLFGPISSLLNVHISVLSSVALFERIFDYLDLDPEIRDAPHARPLTDVRGEIRFEQVSFAYARELRTLRDISFTVPAGQFAALVGPTGAGKTTISYLIPRLYDVEAGRVLLDGQDVRDLTLDSLAAAIGIVSQEPFLFHTTLRDNLRYARPEATDEEIEAAARAAHLHDFIVGLPYGYDTIVGERGYRLSGGEKQRVAIARAILKDPAILILDEATSSVDSATERHIQEAIERLARGRTVVAIAHRLSTIRAADIILVIDGGQLVEQGQHEDLLARGGLYARLAAQQFGTEAAGAPATPLL